MLKKFFIIFFLSTIFSTEIVLKDGKIFEGEIISQDKEKVIIQTSFGQLTFPTEDIITINFQTTQDTNIKTANTIDEKAENNTTLPPYSGYVEALGCKLGDQVGWEKGKYYCYDNQTWVGIDSPLLYLKSLGYKLGEECNREKGLLYSFKGGRWVEFWEEDFSSIAVKENSKNVWAFIGGINYSKIKGDDVEDTNNLKGFRIGVENVLENGFITGVTYSQRGYSYSYSDGDISINENYKIKYIAEYNIKSNECKCDIKYIKKDNIFYNIEGTDNIVIIYTDIYKNGIKIIGPGAGIKEKASGIVEEINDLI